ncbi:hypothetical protein FC36_GL000944 [Ligilactobacillus equi DSM 15833 = JCM 10991]|uniref:Uncharacterized protein n=1 Tax=Ligilactobacillus equi DSM 15833 = JCM 10991 TaxID=1423740 RepID=A0A0R1TMC0_9LACO|nr:hypothetical protein FC36_GL000944 [Ligilactobacillus equi DSM 15833 = JCM 10991]
MTELKIIDGEVDQRTELEKELAESLAARTILNFFQENFDFDVQRRHDLSIIMCTYLS